MGSRENVTDAGASTKPNLGKFPSLQCVLEELRLRYAEEESRREGIDQKAGLLIAAAAITLAIQPFISRTHISIAVSAALATGFAVAAALVALIPARLFQYDRPGGDYGDFYGYAGLSPEEFFDRFVLSYIVVLEDNATTTSSRQGWLSGAYLLLLLALLFTASSVVLSAFS